MGRTFSLWWGSNDELRGERYPGLNGICEALGFDAFHGFAGRLEFGFAFVSDRSQASGVSEREECQHHARIERADEQLFGRPGRCRARANFRNGSMNEPASAGGAGGAVGRLRLTQ
jgi:hypothetical protein